MATLPEDIISAVAIANLKSISEQPAMLSNLAYSNTVAVTNLSQQNAVAHQQAMNELSISILAKAANTISNLGPLEARSAVEVLTNDELAQTIADLKAAAQAFASK
ncbi:R body protein [Dyella sp. 2RAB6]|uniref:R body protein n=1 Tax=Dyella sp. 2RAB6 TaxID=3232992 RepID=UPI003F91A4C5